MAQVFQESFNDSYEFLGFTEEGDVVDNRRDEIDFSVSPINQKEEIKPNSAGGMNGVMCPRCREDLNGIP